MKTQMASSSDEEPDSSDDSKMDKVKEEPAFFSKEKLCDLKSSCYMKKKIISAIKKSLKTNNNRIPHTLTLNDVSLSEEKEIGNGCRQSLNIRIDLNDKLFYSSRDAGAMSIETFKLNDTTPVSKCSHCSQKENSMKDENSPMSYFVCVKCGKKEERRWFHENCKDKCCKSTSIYCDNCLKYKLTSIDHNFEVLQDAKFSKYMYVVTCPSGGGMSLHMDYEKIINLTLDEQRCVAKEFLKEAFKEDKRGFAQFTIAIVHNGSSYMPDLLKLLAELHPTLPVKTTKLKCNIETENMDLGTYYTKVKETYNNGTFAFGPLNETQAASVKNDECGAYLPELLSLLEKSPFLSQVLPWSEMTTKRFKSPHESDDGPIFWCRPGEQIVSLDKNSKRNRWNADEIESFLKERQQNLKFFCEKRYIVEELKKYRRSYSSREFLFEDRTKPHADQVWGNHFEPTAAVGVIQAIHPDEIPEHNRACKEIVVFHAKHFEMLEALLHIDVTAAPKQQCAEWLDDAKLNMIRQMKIRYSKLHLYDNDIYFIPRKIVHQFKTISATLSVAWHTRLTEYYLEQDLPVKEEAEAEVRLSEKSEDESSRSASPVERKPAKRKHKLSYSTDNEATPKKKKPLSRSPSPQIRVTPAKRKVKQRSRSGTPQKREKPAIKKPKAAKTPKKNLNVVIETEESKERSPSPVAETSVLLDRSRSPSPVKREKVRKKSHSRPVSPAKGDADAERRESKRSPSPAGKTASRDRSKSASPVKHDKAKKKKRSRSRSKSPKKRDGDKDSSGGSSVEKKKKRKSRSRSRRGDEGQTRSPTGDDPSVKKSSKKKKKDRSRSRSPKKIDKCKEPSAQSTKNERKSSSSTQTKHNGTHSSEKRKHEKKSRSRSGSPKKSDKVKSHRSRSPKKRDKSSQKIKSRSSSQKGEETRSRAVRSPSPVNAVKATKIHPLRSPSPSVGSMSTEKPSSPEKMSNCDTSLAEYTEVTESPKLIERTDSDEQSTSDVVPENRSTSPSSPERTELDQSEPLSPNAEAEGDTDINADRLPADDVDTAVITRCSPSTQRSTTPPVLVKQEPRSPAVAADRSTEVSVKCEPRSPSCSQAKSVPSVKEEPRSPSKIVKDTEPAVKRVETSTVEKVVKKTVVAEVRSKDHRKEKLWNSPLFSFEDCDKFVLTTRPNSTKNGDKIVKSKTLNSFHQVDKSSKARSRSCSKSPSNERNKNQKSQPVEKTRIDEKKKRDDKEKFPSRNSLPEKRDKEKKSHSEHRHKDERKDSHSSDKSKEKHSSDRAGEKKKSHSSSIKEKSSSESRDKAKSNHHDKTKTKSSSHSNESEKRKRSRSPENHKKKHKQDRSRSPKKIEVTETAPPPAERSAGDEKNQGSQETENYASNYQLMYPRVEIYDIGASLKTKNSAVNPTDNVTKTTTTNSSSELNEPPTLIDESFNADQQSDE